MFNLARKAGYTLAEIDEMDTAFLMDLIIDQSNTATHQAQEANKPHVRKATQEDYDNL